MVMLRPNAGPQEQFLASEADIVVYGGGAGGGKTFAILMDTLRYMFDPNYRAVMFRRETPQITNPGALWDEAQKMYRQEGIDATLNQKDLKVTFPSGAQVKCSHMEHEKDKLSWQGAQLSAVYMDEATHFTASQILYMVSRLRSDAQNASYMRLTCNPDPDHIIRTWIDWWIDEEGFPIPERSGILRYFVAVADDNWVWANSHQELLDDPVAGQFIKDSTGEGDDPKNLISSFTFIPAKLSDNPELLRKNPKYKADLLKMDRVEREKLLAGNWNVKPNAGDYWSRDWVEIVPRHQVPLGTKWVRYWDRAATIPNEVYKDPDYTVGLLMGKCPQGHLYIADIIRFREGPAKVKAKILQTAEHKDPIGTRICIERDPGAAGKSEADSLAKMLGKFDVRIRNVTKSKLTRFLPFAAASENGQIKVCQGSWNETFFKELEAFIGDGVTKDDQVDCCSGGYNEFMEYLNIPDFSIPTGFTKANSFNIT